ncbi:MAG: amidinotransferase [Verrucomicrobia bacterium]|nr:amidinotransferase [Verrucomicrobiota bacterium]
MITTETNLLTDRKSVICSYNEWDPLEEVIVGVVEGATVPEYDLSVRASAPSNQSGFYLKEAGKSFPIELIEKASEELNGFVSILEKMGIVVRRPDPIQNNKPYSTPAWSARSGMYQAMPRDLLLVIGDEIFESPLAWRSRHYEINAYRPILKDYFKQGGKWSAAPRPELLDEFYEESYTETSLGKVPLYAINEFEPTFDAADFIRCGRDIFAQQSNVTNEMGIKWLEQHIGSEYKIHRLEFDDSHPMHIDGSFMPLAPGKLLINPERVKKIPEMFKNWEIIIAPPSTLPNDHPLYMTSSWISMNVFMIDPDHVVCEKQELPTIRALEKAGFEVIALPFRHFYSFGGGFHCATCDVRRNGGLESYF